MNKTAVFVSVMTGLLALLALPVLAQTAEGPYTLEDCIKTALVHNPQLVASAASINAARAGLRQARSSYSPQLTLNAATSANGASGSATTSQSSDGASLILGLTFWETGRQDTVAQSQASLRSTVSSHADDRLTIAKLVADDYYAVLSAAELVAVAQAGVDYAEQHRKQVSRQIEEGTVAAVEVHTVDDDLAQAKLSLISAQGTVREALVALKTDLGLPRLTDLRLAPALVGEQEAAPAEADALATALARRPDLQAQQATVEARRYAVRVAKADRGPALDLTGQAAQSYPDWSDRRSTWSLTAGLSWPLADGGYARAGQQAAEANLASSEANLQTLTIQALQDVQNALISLETTAERIQASEEAVTASTARLQSAEVKYREGLGILIEVTSARQDLSSAQAEAVRARFAYQVARLDLQRAMGTLPVPAASEGAQK